MAEAPRTGYPVTFDVDYPDHKLNRLTTFFRTITLIPIAIVLVVLGTSLLFLPVLLLLVFRRKYPRWWYDWNLQLTRFTNRIGAYALLLRDEYPSTDDEQAVHFEMPYPDATRDINRFMPLVKWFLAIPHYIVLSLLGIVTYVVVVIAWFAILFTGRYPRGLFNFVVGVMRWTNRVEAYAITLVTDVYPPFRLGA